MLPACSLHHLPPPHLSLPRQCPLPLPLLVAAFTVRPHTALEAVVIERLRSGKLGHEYARHLFGELLRAAEPVSSHALTGLLAVVARAGDGPAVSIALFNRMARAGRRAAPSLQTHRVLIDCCCRTHRPDLSSSFLGRTLKAGWRVETISFNHLLNGLCADKRVGDAMDIVLHRMPKLGCAPNAISYNTLLKGVLR